MVPASHGQPAGPGSVRPRAHVLPWTLSVVPTAPQAYLASQRLGWGSAVFHEQPGPQTGPLQACQFSGPQFPLLNLSSVRKVVVGSIS